MINRYTLFTVERVTKKRCLWTWAAGIARITRIGFYHNFQNHRPKRIDNRDFYITFSRLSFAFLMVL